MCYLAADRLLEFYRSSVHSLGGANTSGQSKLVYDPSCSWRTERETPEEAPFFFGSEESAADFFLFALLDDDQRIAQCVASHSGARRRSQSPPLNFFEEAPALQALYAALLRKPAVERALLGPSECQEENLKGLSAERHAGPVPPLPCVATNASTAVSACESPRGARAVDPKNNNSNNNNNYHNNNYHHPQQQPLRQQAKAEARKEERDFQRRLKRKPCQDT